MALAGCTASPANPTSGSADAVRTAIPLTSSTVTASTTWATLAMGHLDDPLNTFWQLLALTAGRSWELATPPGVASNGGLVADALPTSVLAAFGPSQYLRFSPLARSTDQGSSWTPGLLPTGMARVPDALAQGGVESLALLAAAGGTVSVSTGNLAAWRPATTARTLAREPTLSSCRIESLTAVTIDADGSPVVGASCARGGRAGLFAPSSTGWTPVGPGIPGAGGPTEVLRLDHTPAGTAALVSAGTGTGTQLFAMWSTNGLRTWTVSAGLPLDGAALVSTGETGPGGFVVASRAPGFAPTASVITPSATQWQPLPALPAGTTSVAATPTGGFDALVPSQSVLSVYGLGSVGWAKVQRLRVAIQYGSSG